MVHEYLPPRGGGIPEIVGRDWTREHEEAITESHTLPLTTLAPPHIPTTSISSVGKCSWTTNSPTRASGGTSRRMSGLPSTCTEVGFLHTSRHHALSVGTSPSLHPHHAPTSEPTGACTGRKSKTLPPPTSSSPATNTLGGTSSCRLDSTCKNGGVYPAHKTIFRPSPPPAAVGTITT